MSPPFVSVLIPALNEERTLASVVQAVLAVGEDLEIILVDDGSTDRTWARMSELADGERVRALQHPENRGKGAAIRTALAAAQGEVVVIQDADLEYDPSAFPSLLDPIRSGRAQVVYGSRAFSSHTAFSFWYVMGNRAVTLVTNILYNCYLSDIETGYKVIPRELMLSLGLTSRGFELEPEITAKLLLRGVRIFEVPIGYNARSRADGKKLTAGDGVRAVGTLLRLRLGGH